MKPWNRHRILQLKSPKRQRLAPGMHIHEWTTCTDSYDDTYAKCWKCRKVITTAQMRAAGQYEWIRLFD
jgi:hypothetical protein